MIRALAKTTIIDAAVAAGMAEASVMDAFEKQTILLPMPRLEIGYLPEDLRRDYGRICKSVHPLSAIYFGGTAPILPEDVLVGGTAFILPEDVLVGDDSVSNQYKSARFRLYAGELTVRAAIKGDDEDWLDGFIPDFVRALPRKLADEDNNLVIVDVDRAVRGGFGSRIVEPFVNRENVLYVKFKGMICKDVDEPMITEVHFPQEDISFNYATG